MGPASDTASSKPNIKFWRPVSSQSFNTYSSVISIDALYICRSCHWYTVKLSPSCSEGLCYSMQKVNKYITFRYYHSQTASTFFLYTYLCYLFDIPFLCLISIICTSMTSVLPICSTSIINRVDIGTVYHYCTLCSYISITAHNAVIIYN